MNFIELYKSMSEVKGKALEIIANNPDSIYSNVQISVNEGEGNAYGFFWGVRKDMPNEIIGNSICNEEDLEVIAGLMNAKLRATTKSSRIAELEAELAKLKA